MPVNFAKPSLINLQGGEEVWEAAVMCMRSLKPKDHLLVPCSTICTLWWRWYEWPSYSGLNSFSSEMRGQWYRTCQQDSRQAALNTVYEFDKLFCWMHLHSWAARSMLGIGSRVSRWTCDVVTMIANIMLRIVDFTNLQFYYRPSIG